MTLITFSSNYTHSMTQAHLSSINNTINNTAVNLTSEYYSNSEKAAEHAMGYDLSLRYNENDMALQKVQEFSAALDMVSTAHTEALSHIEDIQTIVDGLIENGDTVTDEETYEVGELFDTINELYTQTIFDGSYAFSTSNNSYSLSFGDYDITTSTESFQYSSTALTSAQTNFSSPDYATCAMNLQTIADDIETSLAGITADKATMESITNMIGHQQDSDEEMLSTLLSVDSAAETSTLTQYQMLQQASTSILSQSSSFSSATLSLILKAGG